MPRADRPQVPADYGYSTQPEGMLGWDRVAEALAGASVYWIGTVRPDSSPHMTSIWGGFVDDHLYIEGGDTTRWARNIARDPRVSFGVEVDGLHISGRGSAARASAGESFAALADNYGAKYEYRPESDDFWRIDPSVVIALDMSSLDAFVSSPTRFTFQEES
ncbi:MAG: pyridoxamine 5'-phosphate oxidase family protein [Actinomycetota bacterium]